MQILNEKKKAYFLRKTVNSIAKLIKTLKVGLKLVHLTSEHSN